MIFAVDVATGVVAGAGVRVAVFDGVRVGDRVRVGVDVPSSGVPVGSGAGVSVWIGGGVSVGTGGGAAPTAITAAGGRWRCRRVVAVRERAHAPCEVRVAVCDGRELHGRDRAAAGDLRSAVELVLVVDDAGTDAVLR